LINSKKRYDYEALEQIRIDLLGEGVKQGAAEKRKEQE
jgi:hypothetical protein